jgi:hypothetical protein
MEEGAFPIPGSSFTPENCALRANGFATISVGYGAVRAMAGENSGSLRVAA